MYICGPFQGGQDGKRIGGGGAVVACENFHSRLQRGLLVVFRQMACVCVCGCMYVCI